MSDKPEYSQLANALINHKVELSGLSIKFESLEKMSDELKNYLISLDNKLDQLLEKLANLSEAGAAYKEKIKSIEAQVADLDKKYYTLDRDVVDVKVSMAQKLAYGALGGGMITAIIELTKKMIGN